MNHKRKRPRNARAGCKLCKPWKVNGFATERKDGEKFSDHRRRRVVEEQVRELWKA
jgi:hypothetical protein